MVKDEADRCRCKIVRELICTLSILWEVVGLLIMIDRFSHGTTLRSRPGHQKSVETLHDASETRYTLLSQGSEESPRPD